MFIVEAVGVSRVKHLELIIEHATLILRKRFAHVVILDFAIKIKEECLIHFCNSRAWLGVFYDLGR
jgi:hypothetical protein